MSRLTILVVEDNDTDFELVRWELSRGPVKVDCIRADSEASVRKALDQHPFDLVLSDYALRGFNALGVLKILRDDFPHLPCVVVSGTIGEETAVGVIQAGAKDYVLKDHLSRLNAVVEREVSRHLSERAQELLSRAAHDALWDWDLSTDTVHWNEGLRELFGYEIEGRKTSSAWSRERIHPDDYVRVMKTVQATLKSGLETWLCEYRLRRADASYAYVLDRAYIIRDAKGRMIRAVGAIIDISPQKTAELKILASAQQLRQAQAVARMGSFEFDVETRTYSASDEFYRICELSPDTSVDLDLRYRIVHPEDQDRVLRVVSEAMTRTLPYELDYRMQTQSGNKYVHARAEPVLDHSGKLVKYVGIIQDVTNQTEAELALKHNEEQLRQLQKMDAIGRLAGGIAHDYNNLLAAIQMYCELAQDGATPPIAENLTEIQAIVRRGSALTRQLLLFSRKQPRLKRRLDLNESIRQIEKMLIRLIGETITLKTSGSTGLWPIEGDPGQIDQVLLNLVVNARDAMPEGGRITISTRNLELTTVPLHPSSPKPEPGRFVELRIEDTGIGMSAETQQKIFEPFFTTKPVGQGTGLGLPTVYGIIKEHGGAIGVESEPGQGTAFSLYLPAAPWMDEPDSLEALAPASAPVAETCILVVEDEPDLRKSLERILRHRRNEVITAPDGQQALDRFREKSSRIGIVITDLTMPVMGGIELVQRVRDLRPRIPVIVMTGHTESHEAVASLMDSGPTRFMNKPFSSRELDRLIRELLSPSAPASG